MSDLTPPPPHVVNIDVDSGTVTVESPNDTDYLNAVHVQVGDALELACFDGYICLMNYTLIFVM